MKKFRSVCSVALILSLCLCFTVNVTAFSFPNSFWPLNDRFTAAQSSGDDLGIIESGVASIELVEKLEANADTYGVLASRTFEVANAFERMGDYENAAYYFNKCIPYGEYFGWTDGVNIAKAKVGAFTQSLDLYTLTDEPVSYYGAKHEPVSGAYFGQLLPESEADESMVLIYQEYGQFETLGWLNKAISDIQAAGKITELALNFPGEGSQLDEIIADTEFIDSLCNILRSHPSRPIFLRIGAEMNLWQTGCDGPRFIAAFQKIAKAAWSANPDIATVWSVGHTSTNNVNMNDFYPGDEYVDWVGISAYSVRHFLGKYWDASESFNEIYFKSGSGAEPTLMLKEVLELYGGRKPIMIAECGAARYTRGEVNAESEEWARLNMLRMYSTIFMKYPQIKLIAYFNKPTPDEAQDYDFASSPSMKSSYESITDEKWFIKNGQTSAQSFKKADTVINANQSNLELYVLPYLYNNPEPVVNFYIDGVWSGSCSALPYNANLDLSALSPGTHSLEVAAVNSETGGEKIRKSYTLNIQEHSVPSEIDGFSDTGFLSEPQQYAIKFVADSKIVTGYPDGSYKPLGSITRAEFATMVCRAFNYGADKECEFTDCVGHWASSYIGACVEKGAINGIGGGLFAPEDSVTFEQAAKILLICAGYTDGIDVAYPDGFIAVSAANALFDSVGSREIGSPLSRVDAAIMFRDVMNK